MSQSRLRGEVLLEVFRISSPGGQLCRGIPKILPEIFEPSFGPGQLKARTFPQLGQSARRFTAELLQWKAADGAGSSPRPPLPNPQTPPHQNGTEGSPFAPVPERENLGDRLRVVELKPWNWENPTNPAPAVPWSAFVGEPPTDDTLPTRCGAECTATRRRLQVGAGKPYSLQLMPRQALSPIAVLGRCGWGLSFTPLPRG